MMRTRSLVAALLATLMVGSLAAPAVASTAGVASFTGTASVGHWFRSAAPCDKDGTGVVEGEGLYFPLVVERDRSGVWSLNTVFSFTGQSRGTMLSGPVGGFLDVCGQLDREAAGLGAACGASKGFAGRGRAREDAASRQVDLKLYDVGWKEAVGGVLPVVGGYEEYGTDTVTKGKSGSFVALVRVAPGSLAEADEGVRDCAGLDGRNGAKEFAAAGSAVFLPAGVDLGKGPSGKQCREDGPADKTAEPPPVTSCPTPGPGK